MHRSEQNLVAGLQTTLACFFARMSFSKASALLLDYDGTLAPFCADPAMAAPYPGIREPLQHIQACDRGRIVVVSGRRAKEVARLLELENVEIWGSHGLERLTPERVLELDHLDSRTMQAAARANFMLERAGLAKLIERKSFSSAVHWRGFSVERAIEAQKSVEEVWAAIPGKSLLRMLRFDGGIEICAVSANKGRVVHRVAADLGGQYSMAYLGDDVTDEDAFRAVKGIGLGVLLRDTYRETSADIWIQPPQGLIAFLNKWATACWRRT